MISNIIVASAIEWFDANSGMSDTPVSEWRAARNKWLRHQGICGIIKDGKMSKSIPDWWSDGTQFWFDDNIDEEIFVDRWSNK